MKTIYIAGQPGETGIYAPKLVGPQIGHTIKCNVRWWHDGGGETTHTVQATNLPQAGKILREYYAEKGIEVLDISRAS